MTEQSITREQLWQRGNEIIVNAPQLFIDVDVEADGIAGYGSMLSLGAQSPTGESFYSEIKPHSSDFVPSKQKFCEEHGLQRERLLAEAPELTVVMRGFKRWLDKMRQTYSKPPVCTAFNAAFDWAHVDLGFVLSGIAKSPFGIAPLDLKSLALPLSRDWDFSDTKKHRLPSVIIPDGEFTHHALEDAQYQQKIHCGLAGLLGRQAYLAATRL